MEHTDSASTLSGEGRTFRISGRKLRNCALLRLGHSGGVMIDHSWHRTVQGPECYGNARRLTGRTIRKTGTPSLFCAVLDSSSLRDTIFVTNINICLGLS